MGPRHDYKILTIEQNSTPTDADIRELIPYLDVNNPNCWQALYELNLAYLESKPSTTHGSYQHQLQQTGALQKLWRLCSNTADRNISQLASDLLLLLLNDPIRSEVPRMPAQYILENNLIFGILTNPDFEAAGIETLMEIWKEPDGPERVNAAYAFQGAKSLMENEDDNMADMQGRILHLLTQLMNKDIVVSCVPELICIVDTRRKREQEKVGGPDIPKGLKKTVEELSDKMDLFIKETQRRSNRQKAAADQTSAESRSVQATIAKIPNREKVAQEGNIFHTKEKSHQIIIIGAPMQTGIHRIAFKVLIEKTYWPQFGVHDTSKGDLQDGQTIYQSKSCTYMDSFGNARNHTGSLCSTTFDWIYAGDIVMMEVDLRGKGRERTLYFFVNGKQQKHYFTNLPESVEFCFYIYHPSSEFVEFVSLEAGTERISTERPSDKAHEF